MKLVIVHYHLGDGGVSQVISRQRAILAKMGHHVLVLTGTMCGAAVAPWHRTLDELNYGVPPSGGDGLLERLDRLVDGYWGRAPDVWHFHNHSLGKNAGLAECVKLLARRGARLLLHIHDLAEDGRPLNAAMLGDREFLYPSSPRVHYAFLNPRDRNRFLTAGLPSARASCVGNPIEGRRVSLRDPQRRLLLAPVRGIRRKNLGELVLLAAMVPDDCEIVVTRAPDNPWARVNHNAWGEFACQLALPIQFAVVDRISPDGGAGKSFSD
ncbi:MAG: hypothetical protein ACO3RV_04495, partial [Luteolibacter sp.]